jgi:uncharacterized protein YciI
VAFFVLTREAGRRWDRDRSLREQDAWDEHAAFMEALADEGFILFGGPVGGGETVNRVRFVVEAASEDEVRRRFDDDPWTAMELLVIVGVEAWTVLLGPERLAAVTARPS